MARVVVLGGCGTVGRVAVRALARRAGIEHVVVADIDLPRARSVAVETGPARATAIRVDAGDSVAVRNALEGFDAVLNCIGPYCRFGRTVLQGAIDARVNYVDVCDEVDATLDLLSMDEAAKAAGVTALIGMGLSPGVTNLLGRLTVDMLLDQTEAIDLYHANGGEPAEGPGDVARRLHAMTTDIPVFLDGALRYVRFFEPEGIALRDAVEFRLLGHGIPVYPFPHPEPLTMPRHLSVHRVTNRDTVLPDEYFQRTAEVARLGLASLEPVEVGGAAILPRDFAVAWLLQRRDEILRTTAVGSRRRCVKVVVHGVHHGKPRAYVFHLSSANPDQGEGAGIPAAMGTILMVEGQVTGPGVLPPEAAVEPAEFLALLPRITGQGHKGGLLEAILVEKIDEHGRIERVELPP